MAYPGLDINEDIKNNFHLNPKLSKNFQLSFIFSKNFSSTAKFSNGRPFAFDFQDFWYIFKRKIFNLNVGEWNLRFSQIIFANYFHIFCLSFHDFFSKIAGIWKLKSFWKRSFHWKIIDIMKIEIFKIASLIHFHLSHFHCCSKQINLIPHSSSLIPHPSFLVPHSSSLILHL